MDGSRPDGLDRSESTNGRALDRTLREAQQRLTESPYVGLKEVYCSSENGALLLHGRVNSFFLKQVAQELVRRAEGVQAVVNHLQVGPSQPSRAEEH